MFKLRTSSYPKLPISSPITAESTIAPAQMTTARKSVIAHPGALGGNDLPLSQLAYSEKLAINELFYGSCFFGS
jgi:hypothetical protein